MNTLRLTFGLAFVTLTACGPSAPPAAAPLPATPAANPPTQPPATASVEGAKPPPPGVSPEAPFPAISHQTIKNGLELRVVERHNLPIVELRLIVLSGSASDADKPGLALVAGELLKAGGAGKWNSKELLIQAESLGASLNVLTDRDATYVTMSVTTQHLDAALDLIGAVALKPRFAPVEFQKLREREIERVKSLARTDPGWAAAMVMYRELFDLPTGSHPYEHYDATAAELERVTLDDCRRWHKTHLTPKNALLVVAGDVTPEVAKQSAQRVFGAWKGEAPEKPTFAPPIPRDRRAVFVVDRPESPQSQIYVAGFGPERRSDDWAALRTTNQILGGGVAGRLFLDVREKRSLAYGTGSRVEEVANGPVPLMLSAGTQTPKAPLTVQALLEHAEKLATSAPTSDETAVATRYLADSFLILLEKIGSVADMTGKLEVYGLPDDYYDEYRRRVRAVDSNQVAAAGKRYFDPSRLLIVVAGDAKTLATPLSRFGPVKVVDPDAGFVVARTLNHDPSAKLEP